jgi:hypothetical protein
VRTNCEERMSLGDRIGVLGISNLHGSIAYIYEIGSIRNTASIRNKAIYFFVAFWEKYQLIGVML